MKIKLVKVVRSYRKGDVIEIEDSAGRLLIADGYAVEERQRNLIETATVEERSETADLNPRRKP
jgi:hypothetical protein